MAARRRADRAALDAEEAALRARRVLLRVVVGLIVCVCVCVCVCLF